MDNSKGNKSTATATTATDISNPDNSNNNNNSNITFQILDWDFYHDEDDEGNKKFAIRLFGRDKEQQTVYIQVDDFKPYFYIELQDNWRISTVDMILEEVKKKVPKEHTESLTKFNIEEKYKFWGFTNYKKFKFAKLTFENFDGMKAYARCLTKAYKIPTVSRYWIRLKLYESNILPVLRFMHIRQLEAVGWVSIDKSKLEEFDSIPTCSKLNYKTKWQNIKKVDDRSINKFIIASFDIECKSEDGSFPQPQRDNDRIIQIGITLSRYGETECYERHLLSLKKTAEIEGSIVQSFNTEEDLLLGFTKTLRTIDPDIITGYNIFGFDFMYMMERAKKLGISHRFERLSRVNGEQSPWVDQTLTSAALGTNLMKYYKMTGRVVIDLMKVAQRDYKLSSYKLDYVASYFIRESILNIIQNEKNNTIKIITKSTYGVNIGQYITISYDDGAVESKYNEGEKFQITELGKDYVMLNGKIDTDEFMGKGYKISWCQAKDDVSPQDIFKLADGTPEDRSKVGKYCIMDCELVSKLIAKLQIVTNSVSMANVCNVPLSYLFLRGQGVKIFSLVAKKCREKDHLIPVIQKKEKKKEWGKKDPNAKLDPVEEAQKRMENMLEKLVYQLNNKHKEEEETEEEDELSYEGAIVFPPKPGVYFEPIPVLDYASLYPSSMIFRNLSHECFVNDSRYDNLPGYRYHTITYKVMTKEDMEMTVKEKKEKEKDVNRKEEWVTCRFAERLDGTKGIIPEILQDLLSARKKFKKLMESEKDPFMKSILDGLQLAYKVTANSLYGQTGASTSPVCMKEIAASTTATGREMLQFSKYFIENTFAEIINLALTDKDQYMKRMAEIYKYYPTNISYPDINRATGKITTVNLHVCTDEKYTIPDDKFLVKSIEYEVGSEFGQNVKDLFLQIKKKVKTAKFPEKDDPVGEFGKKVLESLDSEHKSDFANAINNYVIHKEGSCGGIYSTYSEVWELLEINSGEALKDKLLKPLQTAPNDIKTGLMTDLLVLIEFRNYFDNLKVINNTFFNKMYEHVMEKGKPLVDIDFSSTFKNQLFSLKVEERKSFLNDMTKYILKKKGNTSDIYDRYTTFWNSFDLQNNNDLKTIYLKPIQELSDDSKELFINNLGVIIADCGYQGRQELFNKFYEFTNETLKGYSTCPEVIYGDSVTGDTPLLLRKKVNNECDIIVIKSINLLGNEWKQYGAQNVGKIQDDKISYEVWTENGWSKIQRVIKHKTNKKIYEVLTHTGYVRVTEDHSLLKPNGDVFKPTECIIGTELLHSFPKTFNNYKSNIDEDKAYIYGFFMGDGSCGTYDTPSGIKYSWALNNTDSELCKKLKTTCEKIYGSTFKILNTKKSSGGYKIVPSCGDIKSLVMEYINIFYNDEKHKIIPIEVLNGQDEIKKKFLQGLWDSNCCRQDEINIGCHKIDQKSQITAMCIFYFLKSIRYNVSLNTGKDKSDIFRITFSNKNLCKSPTKVKKINEIPYDSEVLEKDTNNELWVYDLETENHHFQAGIGQIIVHNTDSVFYRIGLTDKETKEKLKDKQALKIAIKIGIWSSLLITTLLPRPQAQAYEKVLFPFAIQGKKRYTSNLFEKDPEKFKQKSMGKNTSPNPSKN